MRSVSSLGKQMPEEHLGPQNGELEITPLRASSGTPALPSSRRHDSHRPQWCSPQLYKAGAHLLRCIYVPGLNVFMRKELVIKGCNTLGFGTSSLQPSLVLRSQFPELLQKGFAVASLEWQGHRAQNSGTDSIPIPSPSTE